MRRAAFWWGVLVGVCAGSLLFWSTTFFRQAEELAQEATCSSGLLEARPLFETYKDQHGGRFPAGLDALNLSSATPDALRCSKARSLGIHAYVYIQPQRDAPDDTPILLCWRHPHLLVLCKDGSFKRLPP